MTRTLEYIWVVLVVLTIFAYLLGYLKYISTTLVAVLLITTFIKGQLVIDYFMDLKEVRLKYRLIPTIWLGIILSLISVAYYLPYKL
jgi:cytochrome c oxidase subunit IV